MADIGGAGKASQEMLKELQKMQQQDQHHDPSKSGGDHHSGAKFNQVMNHAQVNEAQNLSKIQEASKPTQTLQAAKTTQISQAVTANPVGKPGETKRAINPAFNSVVKELMAGQNKLEDLMKVAMSGQKLNNQEMIGIQAGVYMYSQQM